MSQSSFSDEICCLILASAQRKLRGYMEFKKFYVMIKYYFEIRGGKSRHSTTVVKLAARAGTGFHSGTSRRLGRSVVQAKCESAYFKTFVEYRLFRTPITFHFFPTNAEKCLLFGVCKVCAKKLPAC